MKITQKKTKKTTLVTTIAAIVILIVSTFIYVVPMNGNLFGWRLKADNETPKRVNDVNLKKPTVDEVKTGDTIKQESLQKDQSDSDKEESSKSIDMTVSAANVNDGVVQIRLLIDDLVSNASCELRLSQGSVTKTYSANVQNLANSSTCQGFNIPVVELGSGKWSFTATVRASSVKVSPASGEVSI